MTKRQSVDTDYALLSKFFKEVGAEMDKVSYSATSKDVAMVKQAEQMGLTPQECAAVIIRNRNKPKRPQA